MYQVRDVRLNIQFNIINEKELTSQILLFPNAFSHKDIKNVQINIKIRVQSLAKKQR